MRARPVPSGKGSEEYGFADKFAVNSHFYKYDKNLQSAFINSES